MSAVREIIYDLSSREDVVGSMVGYCGVERQQCLNGKVEMTSLRLKWKYTDFESSKKNHSILSADRPWQFNKHRPYLQLHSDDISKDLELSGPASKVICRGGDVNLRTAVVPVGLITIAEQ
jgi:hypothetical protein